MEHDRTIAIVGATGLQGREVTRQLLSDGWRVRALTRDATTRRAEAVSRMGAQVVAADSSDPLALDRAFAGVHGVYSVQNHHICGYEGEVAQGKNVAEAASRAGASHLVYASAGPGSGTTGVGSWDVKVAVADHVRKLGVPLTVLRPMAFMELMTERKFYPATSVWHVMPALSGWDRPVPWLSVGDLAVVAAKAFADPDAFVGCDVALASDIRSLQQCRQTWSEVFGRAPRSFPMPVRLFERFSGTDETTMWRWTRSNDVDVDTGFLRSVHPEALTVRSWLAGPRQSAGPGPRAGRWPSRPRGRRAEPGHDS